jgi:hypothetical protein
MRISVSKGQVGQRKSLGQMQSSIHGLVSTRRWLVLEVTANDVVVNNEAASRTSGSYL